MAFPSLPVESPSSLSPSKTGEVTSQENSFGAACVKGHLASWSPARWLLDQQTCWAALSLPEHMKRELEGNSRTKRGDGYLGEARTCQSHGSSGPEPPCRDPFKMVVFRERDLRKKRLWVIPPGGWMEQSWHWMSTPGNHEWRVPSRGSEEHSLG